jgi:uncharacterized membrane protein (DUF2068 family)
MSHQRSWLLSWIVFLKFVKSASLVAIGTFLLESLHRDPVEVVVALANRIDLPATSSIFTHAVTLAMGLTVGKEVALACTSFTYAALLGVEGVGLAMRRHWARWFTIGVTGSLLPFELYEIAMRPTSPLRYLTFVVNVGIVVYLYKKKEAFEP